MNIIIHGPQGCGKSHHGAALAAHFGCSQIVHEWDGIEALPTGALALTNVMPAIVDADVRVIGFDAACREAGISRSWAMCGTVHIDSDLAPLEAAMLELQRLADSDPDAVRAFFEELEASGDVERQLLRIDGEQRTTDGAGYVRIVFEPSERLAEFLVAARANNGLN